MRPVLAAVAAAATAVVRRADTCVARCVYSATLFLLASVVFGSFRGAGLWRVSVANEPRRRLRIWGTSVGG